MRQELELVQLLPQVESIARRAGEAVLAVYERADHEVAYKDDRSPLTAADLASDRLIKEALGALQPRLPVLSEEARALPYGERRHWSSFWLVDPLDGTKEFIKRNGEFTVNIALVEAGVPVLGVVHAPVLDRSYLGRSDRGPAGGGAWRRDGDGALQAITATGSAGPALEVVASRSHPSLGLAAFLAALPDHALVNMGSSLKLCLVADGSADLYPRLGPTMEWDTAAAHAVVLAAGGRVVDAAGAPLVYNKEDLLNPHFIVLSRRDVPWREAWAVAGA